MTIQLTLNPDKIRENLKVSLKVYTKDELIELTREGYDEIWEAELGTTFYASYLEQPQGVFNAPIVFEEYESPVAAKFVRDGNQYIITEAGHQFNLTSSQSLVEREIRNHE